MGRNSPVIGFPPLAFSGGGKRENRGTFKQRRGSFKMGETYFGSGV